MDPAERPRVHPQAGVQGRPGEGSAGTRRRDGDRSSSVLLLVIAQPSHRLPENRFRWTPSGARTLFGGTAVPSQVISRCAPVLATHRQLAAVSTEPCAPAGPPSCRRREVRPLPLREPAGRQSHLEAAEGANEGKRSRGLKCATKESKPGGR